MPDDIVKNTPETPAPVSTPDPDIEFGNSFAEFVGEEKPVVIGSETPTNENEEIPVQGAAEDAASDKETPNEGGDGREVSGGEGESSGAEGEGEGADPPDEGVDSSKVGSPEDDDEDLLNRLGALLAKTKTPEQKAPVREQPAPKAPETAEAEQPLLSPDDMKFIEDTAGDWPDVMRAVRLERDAVMHRAVDYVFREIAKELRPWMETVQAVAQRTHLQELQSKVPDYDTVTSGVEEWVGKQPAYLQAAYNHVIQQGTAEEVADLIARFRADTGKSTNQAPPKKTKAELPTATKQAVAALAPVSTKRTSPTGGGIDPGDFDGAFEAFANKV